MIEFLIEAVKSTIFNPAWLIPYCILMGGFFALIHLGWKKLEEVARKGQDADYNCLLKQYYHQYGDYVFEINEIVDEIRFICEKSIYKKTPQEIRLDLKSLSEKSSRSEHITPNGIWLMLAGSCIKIHPVNRETEIYHVKIRENSISLSERVENRWYHFSSDDSSRYKRGLYQIDISHYCATDSTDDTIWKDCTRYNVTKNTVLKVLVEAMGTCYDISSCFLTDTKAKNRCNKYTNLINSLLQPYNIKTEMTQKSWQFYFNDAPITLEEVIKKLPDEVLSKRLDPPPSKPPKALTPSQSQLRVSFPSVTQKVPTPPPKTPNKPNLSIEEELLNYLKVQPVKWEYPIRNQDESLHQFCSSLIFSENVIAFSSDENIRTLELAVQQKRARNSQLADHNTAMEGNILSLVYKCSYLMHIFPAMEAIKFDTTKVDVQKLWLLIQQDCNSRISNQAEEKRKNPAIQAVINKYNHDYQTMNLKVLNNATGREMDYIIYTIMSSFLVLIISLLFSNPQLLQSLKQYSTDDVMGTMYNNVLAAAALRFTAYSGSGGLSFKERSI